MDDTTEAGEAFKLQRRVRSRGVVPRLQTPIGICVTAAE
jgi:hypothetical protein